MVIVLESGLRKVDAMCANAAKLRRYAAMNIMRGVIKTPKNSMTKPTMNIIAPKIRRLSLIAFQILLISKTGHA